MSSSFIVEPHQSGSKKDDTLIIVVNDDGTISVDQETLQNLIMNQSDAKVSVVRVGQSEGDAENGDLTLTVDPPTFERSENQNPAISAAVSSDVTGLVDPFMEMDPEQLEKLETALQSEQAKQILGENVTAMLDMLTVEEQQKSIKYCVELDHCYTSRTSPADPEPSDPLPIANSPETGEDVDIVKHPLQQPIILETNIESTTPIARSKIMHRNQITRSVVRGGRKVATVAQPAVAVKTHGATTPRTANLLQQSPNKGINRTEAEQKEEDSMSPSESSESEPPSDNDSDFGPRGPRRGGIRARGGRKGLTTRGGSASAGVRRRSANKQMDIDQVRRLDMEMAAAVVAMKSPEKSERPDRFNPVRAKKRTRGNVGRKKEDSSPSRGITSPSSPAISGENSPVEKPLQTTNQVKANLISANMIKGDMILTKPGQERNNQKVLFVQKRVPVRPSDSKPPGTPKESINVAESGTTVLVQIQPKVGASDDGKLVAVAGRSLSSNFEPPQTKTATNSPILSSAASTIGLEQQEPPRIDAPSSQLPQQLLQHEQESTVAPSPALRTKGMDVKREKRKSESEAKGDESLKPLEAKTPDVTKKPLKKEQRKAPAVLADSLGPALFSTPDIIRRVSSESKSTENLGTPTIQTPASLQDSTNSGADILTSSVSTRSHSAAGISEHDVGTSGDSFADAADGAKSDSKAPTVEELEPSLDPAANVNRIPDAPVLEKPRDTPVVPNEIIPEQSGMEGEENLLASLDMGAGVSNHDVELLAEALLLQDALGVDLGDHPVLAESSNTVSEPLLSTSTTFEEQLAAAGRRNEISTKTAELAKCGESGIATSAVSSIKDVRESVEVPKKRDDKEPIQIIRGGRVITLPPIEAPATRSKRLQAKPEPAPISIEIKKEEKIVKQFVQKPREIEESSLDHMNIGHVNDQREIPDDDDDEDDEEENSDSEDDPDRLWCICKRPHNNRFMICCDVCEDWFHGKCVHVSKAMGQQMEEKGIEWVCPNCAKKKDQGPTEQKRILATTMKPLSKPEVDRSPRAPRASGSTSEKVRKAPVQPIATETPAPPVILAPQVGVTQCVVCKKEARNSSIYCSDACILAHAQETLTRDSKPSVQTRVAQGQTAEIPPKPATDARVIVFERRTGKVLTGTDAPTRSNLKTWLKENPTFEVVRPNNVNTLQIGGKTVTAIQTQGVPKIVKTSPGTSPGAQSKMVYAKVIGSKQTVLAPSNKKLVLISGNQQRVSPKLTQQKAQVSPTPVKSPVMRQTTIKITPQGVRSPTTSTGKQTTIVKKQEVAKATPTSQQQASQQQQPQQQQQQQQQQKPVQKTPGKKAEPEPIRLNVRKTLAELLTARIRECNDLSLTDEEINELALNIELELYKCFRDTGAKYKSKYRSLVFNIKDTKNLTLFRKIADRSLTPDAVVRLSPEEMASQELAEWREKETKHQLEMIKKNELDLMAQAKSIVVKTHKGELIIENDTGIGHVDPKTPVQDIVTALNSHEAENEENKDDGVKTGQSSASEDSKWSKSGVTTTSTTTTTTTTTTTMTTTGGSSGDEKKKKDRERRRDRGSGDSKSGSKSNEDGKSSKSKRSEEEDRRRSHSRGQSRHSRERERSRDRKSTRSKESKREGEKEGKDRERHKSNKESRQRDKDRDRRSRGKNKDRRSRRDEDGGGRKKDADKRNEGGQGASGEEAKPIEDRLWRHVEDETTTSMMSGTMLSTSSTLLDGNDSDVSDREPSSTVNIKTPDINEEAEREKDSAPVIVEASQLQQKQQALQKSGQSQTVWRGFVNMVDVAKFFITAQEVSGDARDLMEDLPDTVDVVGRISHEAVWDYISKMKKSGSKEILVIRLTAANDEEKIPYITLYSYLNSRSRLGVVGNVSKNIKDFYIMPFSRQSQIPEVLLPFVGPGFEDQRPHLLLGIIVRNKRKRVATASPVAAPPAKISKKDEEESSEKVRSHHHHHHHHHQSPPDSPRPAHKGLLLESLREKQTAIAQMTLGTLNKAHVGISRTTMIDNATISKLVPELSSKIDLSESPKGDGTPPLPLPTPPTTVSTADGLADEDDEPYSPGGATDVDETEDPDDIRIVRPTVVDSPTSNLLSPAKNSSDLQRKMDELNRQIEEQKQQIQSISSSFLGEAAVTLPGLGLDPPGACDSDEAYSPTDARSFTPPPPGIAKFAQPILDKVSDITIPPNLQEILANVKRQESSKVDPYLPSKPSATFLTSSNSPVYSIKTADKYTPTFINKSGSQGSSESSSGAKETKSTLRSLSDLDLIKKAEEELAAVAAAAGTTTTTTTTTSGSIYPQIDAQSVPVPPPSFSSPPPPLPPPPPPSSAIPEAREPAIDMLSYPPPMLPDADKKGAASVSMEQPKPPGLEDEDLPVIFPSSGPGSAETSPRSTQKFVPKSGVVLSVKRKVPDDGAPSSPLTPSKAPRTKSRWGQGPNE